MAQKSKSSARPSWEADFVSCELSKETKEQLKKWDVKGELTFDLVSKLVDDGYKLSISADKSHDCVGAYLTSPSSVDGSRKRILSARGPDLFGALRAIAFKHAIVLEGEWGNVDNKYDPQDSWG